VFHEGGSKQSGAILAIQHSIISNQDQNIMFKLPNQAAPVSEVSEWLLA